MRFPLFSPQYKNDLNLEGVEAHITCFSRHSCSADGSNVRAGQEFLYHML